MKIGKSKKQILFVVLSLFLSNLVVLHADPFNPGYDDDEFDKWWSQECSRGSRRYRCPTAPSPACEWSDNIDDREYEGRKRVRNNHPEIADGRTLLHKALETCNDYSIKGCQYASLCTKAGKEDVSKALSFIHKDDVDREAEDTDGKRPLHLAVMYGHKGVVEAFVEKGVALGAQDSKGQTPLHIAARFNRIDEAEMLVAHDAPLLVSNNHGQTPLHVAAVYNNPEVAQLLIENGACTKARDQKGRTPVELARENGNVEILKLLLGSDGWHTKTLFLQLVHNNHGIYYYDFTPQTDEKITMLAFLLREELFKRNTKKLCKHLEHIARNVTQDPDHVYKGKNFEFLYKPQSNEIELSQIETGQKITMPVQRFLDILIRWGKVVKDQHPDQVMLCMDDADNVSFTVMENS